MLSKILLTVLLHLVLPVNAADTEKNTPAQKQPAPIIKQKKSVPVSLKTLPQMQNPFVIRPQLMSYQPQYKERVLTAEHIATIKAYIDKINKSPTKPPALHYRDIGFIDQKKLIRLLDIENTAASQAMLLKQGTHHTKQMDLRWFDTHHAAPQFFWAELLQVLKPSPTYLASPDGQIFSAFMRHLSLKPQQLSHSLQVVFDASIKPQSFTLLINDEWPGLGTYRVLLELDSISQGLYDLIFDPALNIKSPEMLLPLLSSVRLKSLALKLRLQHPIDRYLQALPDTEAQTLQKDIENLRKLSPVDLKKRYQLSADEAVVHAYQQAIFQFLDNKKDLILRIQPEIPQALSSLFTAVIMLRAQPSLVTKMIDFYQLSLKNE